MNDNLLNPTQTDDEAEMGIPGEARRRGMLGPNGDGDTTAPEGRTGSDYNVIGENGGTDLGKGNVAGQETNPD